MVGNNLEVVWDNEAKQQLRELYNYIKKDSPQNATKVSTDILELIKKLTKNPENMQP